MTYLWTSESVSSGHPDKVADQISDAILDAYLAKDPNSRVAVETLVTSNMIIVAGEVTSDATIDTEAIARQTVIDIGYGCPRSGFNGYDCGFISKIHKQSPEINSAAKIGAGDQGIMFGYAENTTPNFMPLTLFIAKKVLEMVGEEKLGIDAKSQVTIEYDDVNPIKIDTIVVSVQHDELPVEEVKILVKNTIYRRFHTLPPNISSLLRDDTKFYINQGGTWNLGGPATDTGLTGRKIVVDNYGADCPIGGGAFSGKDPSKVDRSGAYAARHLAKNIVAQGFADRATIQLSYVIGKNEPISLRVISNNDFDTSLIKVGFSVSEIIDRLNLKQPIYLKTARFGHFGVEDYSWEKLDMKI